ncbi:MAG: exosome non-catalytic core subunit rrp40 [Icmadophila ericetorum]|nr:exosome non-catalytic core subunit rrp40 [Icmadophila ericetorum]
MVGQMLVLPGEEISSEVLPTPSNPNMPLKLGPGLRLVSPSTITPVSAGSLCIDNRKNAIWVENNSGRYIPQTNDIVLAIVHHSAVEAFHCALTPYTTFAQLPHLAFEGASKKTRPQLSAGGLVYARVVSASKYTEPELACVNPSTGKNEGLGPLTGGMLFDISLGMARRLLMAKQEQEARLVLLEEFEKAIPFEIAVGRNGKVWVNSGGAKEILMIGKALQETDRRALGLEDQRKLVRASLKPS